MSARFHDLFDPRQVVLDLRAKSGGEAIIEIVQLLRDQGRVTELYPFADAVMVREGRSSTNTGEGVAFPHARTDLVDDIVLGIGRSAAGVQFVGSKVPVNLIFLVGVPQRMVTDYLVCIGSIARILKTAGNREGLMTAAEPEAFVEILRSGALLLE